MKRNAMFVLFAVVFSLVLGSAAFAHTPLFTCWDNGDGTISCEGGFSDGSSAAGVEIRVEKKDGGEVLHATTLDQFSEATFDKPDVPFVVIFDAGEGHRITIDGENIF